jgi:hypothetical protein
MIWPSWCNGSERRKLNPKRESRFFEEEVIDLYEEAYLKVCPRRTSMLCSVSPNPYPRKRAEGGGFSCNAFFSAIDF